MTYPAPIPQPAGKRTSNNGISANYTKRGRIATGLTFALGYVVVLWLVHLVNTFIFGGVLTNFGIHPLDFNGLLGIITSPFLHANFEHLIRSEERRVGKGCSTRRMVTDCNIRGDYESIQSSHGN